VADSTIGRKVAAPALGQAPIACRASAWSGLATQGADGSICRHLRVGLEVSVVKVWGRGLTPYGVLVLADEYRLSGDVLGRGGRLSEKNPRRLLYLHALETYLRALLCLSGHTPEEIRKFNHDIEAMLTQCETDGLKVKRQSLRFIEAVAATGDRRLCAGSVRYRPQLSRRNLAAPATTQCQYDAVASQIVSHSVV
jgi:hypothetical protein